MVIYSRRKKNTRFVLYLRFYIKCRRPHRRRRIAVPIQLVRTKLGSMNWYNSYTINLKKNIFFL